MLLEVIWQDQEENLRFSLTVLPIDDHLSQNCVDVTDPLLSGKLDHQMLTCYQEYSLSFQGYFSVLDQRGDSGSMCPRLCSLLQLLIQIEVIIEEDDYPEVDQ